MILPVRKPRVLLADDHTLVMEGVQSLLAQHCEFVGFAVNGRDLVNQVRRVRPDIVILDISMPELNGIEAARQIRRELPRTKVIFLTMYSDALYVNEALQAGAGGFVLKSSVSSELLAAIQAVSAGERYITPLLKVPSLDHSLRGSPPVTGPLTGRQREVLQLVAEGKSMKQIASELNVSIKTAEFHKSSLMRRLGMHTTAELVKYAVRTGVTSS
jgi:DNA-binding NarL/FixJ family response regulator